MSFAILHLPKYETQVSISSFPSYASQLNVQDSGAVVASPDDDPDYYYHWMRDGALSIKTWMDINGNDYSVVREKVDAYVDWVQNVQGKVRLENMILKCI